jgi:[NiFe] hydrogenase diaphorase moiety large subunit
MQRKLQKISLDLASPEDYEEIRQWGRIMRDTSRCGLGRAATRALTTALDKFPEYFERHIDQEVEGLNKQFDMERAVMEYERFKS